MDDADGARGLTRGGRLLELRKRSAALTAQFLRDNGPVVLTDVAAATGLSRPTVMDRVGELVELGAADVAGKRVATSKESGRPAMRYRFRGEIGYVAAVEIGKRSTHLLVSDLAGTVVAARRWVDERIDPDAPASGEVVDARLEEVWSAIAALVPRPERSAGLLGVGVCLQGLLGADGVVTRSTDFPGLIGVDVAGRTREKLGVPARVDHDLAAAGVAEHRLGAAQGLASFVLATAWPTVAASLMIDGVPYGGAENRAGVMYRMDLSSLLPNPYAGDDAGLLRDLTDHRAGAPLSTGLRAVDDLIAVQLAAAGATLDPQAVLLLGPAVEADPGVIDRLAERLPAFVSADFPIELRRAVLGPIAPVVGTLLRTLDEASSRFFEDRMSPIPRLTRAAKVTDAWLEGIRPEESQRA
ncbi:ROK family transcriptional regulator [Microbacterium sp. EST19A]|uniref:ROK family transcriptional regulator n=1 Tax=Microbacterium sp. EST19A TaxID=2862681 RepID=UPI001CBED93D|nr:ROK family transcriptional regulator [Microbacterium sp. EST19A]